MPKLIDLTGQRFARLTVLRRGVTRGPRVHWHCRCDCGVEKDVSGVDMRQGKVKSCGCWRVEDIGNRRRTHGMSSTRTFKCWQGMMRRCYEPARRDFQHYGGRGIRVCDRWREAFENFLADMGEMPVGMSLDRQDHDGDYSPGNCRWINQIAQIENRRNTIWVEMDGQRLTQHAAARALQLPVNSIRRWMKDGLSFEDAAARTRERMRSGPVRPRPRLKTDLAASSC